MVENERARERASGALNTLLSPLSQRIHPVPDADEGGRTHDGGGEPAGRVAMGDSEAAGRWPHSGVNRQPRNKEPIGKCFEMG